MGEERAAVVGPAGIDVAYERLGDPQAPPVLLVMGVGAQMINWPDGLCAALLARGLQVIRFDNRDVGLSSHFSHAPAPDLQAALSGDTSCTLSDMAADAVGLVDALGLRSAHIVGASMGGAIAQTVAIEHPGRVRSLTSMMSTTGDMAVGQAHPDILAKVFSGRAATSREEVIERMVNGLRAVGSPGFDFDEVGALNTAGRAYDRAYDPLGVARQALASVASGDRTSALQSLVVPTLIIPGAELVIFEGMGHSLPRALWPEIASRVASLVQRAELARG